MAKTRVTLFTTNDNETLESQYRDQIKKEKECIEGSALEQKYNSVYWNDYSSTYNYQYVVWNTADSCTLPGSTATGGNYPYSWTSLLAKDVVNGATNKAACEKFIGYVYTSAAGDNPDHQYDQCVQRNCGDAITATTDTRDKKKAACEGSAGCIFVADANDNTNNDRCVFPSPTSCKQNGRWVAGTNTAQECEQLKGCVYKRGVNNNYRRDDKGLLNSDDCVPGCTPFVAGTGTQKDCEVLGCTYAGGDKEEDRDKRPGFNLKTQQDVDNCPADRHPPQRSIGTVCGINPKLGVNADPDACDDRTYIPGSPFSCTKESLTTEEACKSGYGTWTAPPKSCRELFSTVRSRCEFLLRDAKSETVYQNLSHHGGNLKPGTPYEKCVQDHYDEKDVVRTEMVVGYDGEKNELPAYLSPDEHERIYGYRTPEEYCGHQLELKLQDCQRAYEASVAGCHAQVEANQVTSEKWTRSPIQVKAARSACHRIYGCMYSKSNERCSVWAVWAYVFFLVLMIVVVVAVLAVGAVFVLPILKSSSA